MRLNPYAGARRGGGRPRPHPRRRSEAGFTLVELLVAATLAGVGLLGLAATHATALKATNVGRNMSLAAIRAGDDIEVLRRLPYEDVVSGAAEDLSIGNRVFTRQVEVEPAPTGTSKRVQVTVSWTDRFGPHQVVLTSVVAP